VVGNCTGWGLGADAGLGVWSSCMEGAIQLSQPYHQDATQCRSLPPLLPHSILSPPMLTEFAVRFCIVVVL